VGEFCFEWGGVTKGRYFLDGLINEGGFECWAGRAHVIVDPAKSCKAIALGLALMIATFLPSVAQLGDVEALSPPAYSSEVIDSPPF
jgi:hypothetical protein